MMKAGILLGLILCLLLLSACVPGSERFSDPSRPAGFFWGIWHGWIAPISLIWQIFNAKVRIYETNNMGWIYDLGFYLAIVGGFGSLEIFRKSK